MESKKPFIGIEAEGPHRGQKTLFIPGSVTPIDFMAASMLHGKEVNRVYFGAGGDRELNGFTLAAIVQAFPPQSVTIEVEEVGDLWPCFHGHHTIVSLTPIDLMERANYYKVVENELIKWLGGPEDEYVTKMDDPLFATDKEIEL